MITTKFMPREQYMAQLQEERMRRLAALEKNVPAEMQSLPHWCVFKTYYNQETKQRQKYILRTSDGKWAKSNQPSEWSSFEVALEYARNNKCTGLSFALEGSGMTCIDLDHSRQANGKYSALAQEVMQLAGDTYTERSISGEGLHVFVKGNVLQGKYKNRNDEISLEVYDSARFISMTGDILGSNQLLECSEDLKISLRQKLGRKTEYSQNVSAVNNESDRDIIEILRRSSKGGDFSRMFDMGEDIKGNRSVTDFTLLNMLAWATRRDVMQMERIFRASALYRPEKENYMKHSAEKAAATCYNVRGEGRGGGAYAK